MFQMETNSIVCQGWRSRSP